MRFLGGIWKRKINGETLDYYPCPYMVGDIFITTNSIKPEIRYPGTEWEELPEETYLMIASSAHPVKSTCGENEHTLTIDEMPQHYHQLIDKSIGTRPQSGWGSGTSNTNIIATTAPNAMGRYIDTANVGGNKPHNNMPKSYAIYGYRRIA